MAVTEQSRHAMVEVLIEHLGEEVAMTLVEHLPPAGWSDVATRQDVEALGRELRAEIGSLRTELHTEIGGLRTELHTEIGGLRTELHTEIADLRVELHDRLSDLHDRSADTTRTLVLAFVGALTANTAVILTAIGLSGG